KHRGESFAACEFIMDYLKSEAPFWKKEQTPAGARWVDARVTDDKALARWGITTTNAAASTANPPDASAQPNDYE
ncbi:MAG: molybdenum cofactor biosynthesis protein MoaE, partial [Betaproteobacteria bacterium]|nr:molybdenum cofactor biosynthesis protein MoaE [Betaproteobacteria bacterium]